MYAQPPENTLESLVHGMEMFDAIEFDIRLTKDNHVVIHHDRSVSIDPSKRKDNPTFVELWELDDLLELGFCSLEMLLENKSIQKSVQEQGKVLIVESKRPSLKIKESGGWFARKKHDTHMGALMKRADELLDQYEIPKQSAVHYAFHRSMSRAIKVGNVQRNWSTLLPLVRPFAGRTTQRILAFPEYLTTSFSRMLKKHRTNRSPMMPCAVEYLTAPANVIPIGRSVGLHGRKLSRLTSIRKGFPVYVWPVSPSIERAVLNAGLSALTDDSNPEMTWLPGGGARWTQPATLPLDAEQSKQLERATKENHRNVLDVLKKEAIPWMECDASRKRELLTFWRNKWQWSQTVDDLLSFEEDNGSMPWELVRMVGHRGAGKSKRPVL